MIKVVMYKNEHNGFGLSCIFMPKRLWIYLDFGKYTVTVIIGKGEGDKPIGFTIER